ncbi:MAG: GFA family protein, partial [Gammaproteobacteria bacterium]|nr:GFA family protein [Gammaproteobacteria bacterium]
KFTAEDIDTHVHACHCSMCRGWTGGPMLAASVGSVEFSGESNIKRYASSEWAERGFCAQCGSSLFYHLKEPNMYIMATGCFDNAEQFSLAGEIFIDEKPSSYNFAGDHSRLTGEEFLASMAGGGDS